MIAGSDNIWTKSIRKLIKKTSPCWEKLPGLKLYTKAALDRIRMNAILFPNPNFHIPVSCSERRTAAGRLQSDVVFAGLIPRPTAFYISKDQSFTFLFSTDVLKFATLFFHFTDSRWLLPGWQTFHTSRHWTTLHLWTHVLKPVKANVHSFSKQFLTPTGRKSLTVNSLFWESTSTC